jgi:hypothetical protein
MAVLVIGFAVLVMTIKRIPEMFVTTFLRDLR